MSYDALVTGFQPLPALCKKTGFKYTSKNIHIVKTKKPACDEHWYPEGNDMVYSYPVELFNMGTGMFFLHRLSLSNEIERKRYEQIKQGKVFFSVGSFRSPESVRKIVEFPILNTSKSTKFNYVAEIEHVAYTTNPALKHSPLTAELCPHEHFTKLGDLSKPLTYGDL